MKIRKILAVAFAALMVVGLLAGCTSGTSSSTAASTPPASGSTPAASSTAGPDVDFSVALMLNGTLGDKSFFDSANNGMKMIEEQLGATTKVVEVGYDDTKWEPALRDLCDDGSYDVIICGTWQVSGILATVAPEYPDQKFIIFDSEMDYTDGAFPNVFSITYKQNDGSFLAGVLAASMTESNNIGFVGGMDNEVINDFLVGYIQGAQAANPDIKVASSYVGDFSNTARAKELALAQYQMGVDVIFSCASTAGDGTMEAGKELGKGLIGVDSDQAMLYKDTDPDLANLIYSSMLKRVDVSLFRAIEAAMDGTLAYGTAESMGLAEDCVGLADNEYYQANVPQDVRALIDDYITKIKGGEIEVLSAFTMETQELKDFIDGAK